MSENKFIGSLVLRTIDIEPTRERPILNIFGPPYENNYGIYDGAGGVVTWKNIDMRSCLGELYYNYDRFNLKLTALHLTPTSGVNIEMNHMIYMSGLPFSSSYNTRLGPMNQVAIGCVTTADVLTGTGAVRPIVSGLVSFYKPLQNPLNITVEFKNSSTIVVNGYTEKYDRRLGHWSMVCDIYGIDK